MQEHDVVVYMLHVFGVGLHVYLSKSACLPFLQSPVHQLANDQQMAGCRYGKFNIQAGTQFCDKSFSEEIANGSISSASLDKYTCVALAGVSAEFLKFGRAEGGLGDVQQLDALLRAIGVR